jgi:PAS domain-containing protein
MTRLASIPENRKQKLDTLFDAFSIIGDDTYVYLCDMRYDISRWSKSLVEAYDLPGEYMIAAGDIWEEHIHPEDRRIFHDGIEDIFSGRTATHDMQYRARRKDGEYDVCVEGIETVGMRDILKKFGIHSFQGYFYSKPIELDNILDGLQSDAGALCFRKNG